jgi:hypothetical protein
VSREKKKPAASINKTLRAFFLVFASALENEANAQQQPAHCSSVPFFVIFN